MAIINRGEEIINALKDQGFVTELSLEDSARISADIDNEMKNVKRDFNRKESQSIESASKLILTC